VTAQAGLAHSPNLGWYIGTVIILAIAAIAATVWIHVHGF
jgi:hypothetical protein